MKVINYGFPLTDEQREQLAEAVGEDIEVVDIRANFDLDAPGTSQIEVLLDEAGMTTEEWATTPMVVNTPGMSWAAAMSIAGYAGKAGYMPSILRLIQRDSEGARVFDVKEIINLQRVRDEARETREELTEPVEKSGKARVVNFSHPLTAAQLVDLAGATGYKLGNLDVINVKVQVDISLPFAEQVRQLMDGVPLTSAQWQTEDIVVNLPGLGPVACLVMAEANARMGYFPLVVRLKRADSSFVFAELLDPQGFRIAMRTNSHPVEAKVAITGISVSEDQISQIAKILEIPEETIKVS